jgi:ribosomal protein S18 acetylase RimI-like enzyme
MSDAGGPRRATVDDHAAIARLLAEADALHAELVPGYFRRPDRSGRASRPTHAERGRTELERVLAAADEAMWVIADESGEIAGLVHAQIYDTPPQPALVPKRRCHIDSLIVTASARRRGLGRRLVEAASAWARTKGAAEVLLTVWAGNQAAEQFYGALGFARVSSVLGRPL